MEVELEAKELENMEKKTSIGGNEGSYTIINVFNIKHILYTFQLYSY